MRLPSPGLVFAVLTGLLAAAALSQHGRHDAPAAPPMGGPNALLADVTQIDILALQTPPPDPKRRVRGAAGAISEAGVWLTAESVVHRCAAPMVMITPVRGLPARVIASEPGGAALLQTRVGAPALPMADRPLGAGERAYHPGFPRQTAGELTSRRMDSPGGAHDVYAEIGRTDGMGGGLMALAGTPVLDEAGRITGLTLSETPRRGRLFALPLATLRTLLTAQRITPSPTAEGRVLTVDNYGIVGDALRRTSSVAAVVCLDPIPDLISALPGSVPR